MDTEDKYLKDSLAFQIYDSVVSSVNEYAHDSTVSKFFLLPEPIINLYALIANTLSAASYVPNFQLEETNNLPIRAIFYVTAVSGLQIYLKERSVLTNSAPYKWKENEKEIVKVSIKIKKILNEKTKISQVAGQVMAKTVSRLSPSKEDLDLEIEGRKFFRRKFNHNLWLAVAWGYFFAKELVVDN